MATMKRFGITLFCAGLFCSTSSFASPEKDTVLATVNGRPITQSTYDDYLADWQKQNKERENAVKSEILEELVQVELIKQEAEKLNIEQEPEFKRQMELIKTKLFIREITSRAVEKLTISDGLLQKKYDQMLTSTDLSEYKIRHILTESSQDAEAVIRELDNGKNFADLAKQKSIDTSGQNGGELGWVSAADMDAGIIQALKQLQARQYSKTPVQSQYGWHILMLDETRQKTPYSLAEVKTQLISIIKGEHFAHYLQTLQEKADIKLNP